MVLDDLHNPAANTLNVGGSHQAAARRCHALYRHQLDRKLSALEREHRREHAQIVARREEARQELTRMRKEKDMSFQGQENFHGQNQGQRKHHLVRRRQYKHGNNDMDDKVRGGSSADVNSLHSTRTSASLRMSTRSKGILGRSTSSYQSQRPRHSSTGSASEGSDAFSDESETVTVAPVVRQGSRTRDSGLESSGSDSDSDCGAPKDIPHSRISSRPPTTKEAEMSHYVDQHRYLRRHYGDLVSAIVNRSPSLSQSMTTSHVPPVVKKHNLSSEQNDTRRRSIDATVVSYHSGEQLHIKTKVDAWNDRRPPVAALTIRALRTYDFHHQEDLSSINPPVTNEEGPDSASSKKMKGPQIGIPQLAKPRETHISESELPQERDAKPAYSIRGLQKSVTKWKQAVKSNKSSSDRHDNGPGVDVCNVSKKGEESKLESKPQLKPEVKRELKQEPKREVKREASLDQEGTYSSKAVQQAVSKWKCIGQLKDKQTGFLPPAPQQNDRNPLLLVEIEEGDAGNAISGSNSSSSNNSNIITNSSLLHIANARRHSLQFPDLTIIPEMQRDSLDKTASVRGMSSGEQARDSLTPSPCPSARSAISNHRRSSMPANALQLSRSSRTLSANEDTAGSSSVYEGLRSARRGSEGSTCISAEQHALARGRRLSDIPDAAIFREAAKGADASAVTSYQGVVRETAQGWTKLRSYLTTLAAIKKVEATPSNTQTRLIKRKNSTAQLVNFLKEVNAGRSTAELLQMEKERKRLSSIGMPTEDET